MKITTDAFGREWQHIETDHGTIAHYLEGKLVSETEAG